MLMYSPNQMTEGMILGLLAGLIYGALGMLWYWVKCESRQKAREKQIEQELKRIVLENPGVTPEELADMLYDLLHQEDVKFIRFQRCMRFTIEASGKTEVATVDYPV